MNRFTLILTSFCLLSTSSLKAEPITLTVTGAVAAVVGAGVGMKKFIDSKQHCQKLCNRFTCGVGLEDVPGVADLKKYVEERYGKNLPLTTFGNFCKYTCQDEITRYMSVPNNFDILTGEEIAMPSPQGEAKENIPPQPDQLKGDVSEVPIVIKKRFAKGWSIEKCVQAHNDYIRGKGIGEHKSNKSIAVYSRNELQLVKKIIKTGNVTELMKYFHDNRNSQ